MDEPTPDESTPDESTDALALERAILDLVRRPGYQPIKPRVIAQRLRVAKEQVDDVKKAVKRLVRRGHLAYRASHLVESADPVKPKGNRVVGVFRRREAGFGFVRPSGSAPDDVAMADIYIPAEDAGDAASGDIVVVEIGKRPSERFRGPRGRIVEIFQRETHQFVGTYDEEAGSAIVRVDGTLFARPILVGDPGASGANPGDKIVLEMVQFPSHLHDGEGVITRVLGPRGDPGVDTLSIIHEFNLPTEFPEDALEEARKEAERFDAAIGPERLDLTGETVVTIDPVDARDFDDAISLTRTEEGHWRLGVHIADVSHFVRPGTALDREAQKRATSVYLPDRVLPMLPEVISNALASLQPDKVRYTKTVFIEFTPEGLRADSEFHTSAIKSTKRLAYEQVDEFLTDPDAGRKRFGLKVHDLLLAMRELARVLRRRRVQRGALELDMPEVKIDLDKHGRVAGAHVAHQTESRQIIEEFMLAANEAVAEMLRQSPLPFLRRIHKAPSLRKLKALTEFVSGLGLSAENLQNRFELQELLRRVTGRPEQQAVNYAVLRSLQRAVYGPEDEGHFALASECYCHFTSPIRRYPDLTVHRLIGALSSGHKAHADFGELVLLGEHCSQREQRAEEAERELTKVKLLAYLAGRIGEEMDGVITGVESFGLFVQGLELPAEGLLHVDALRDDFYRYDRAAHTLAGHRSGNAFRLGDPVRVVVARVDVDRRELDFHLVGHKPRPRGDGPAVRRGKKASGRDRADGGPRGRKPAKRGRRRG